MRQIGEIVIYGSKGVCKIEEICNLDMSGEMKEYYVLAPLYDKSTKVYVPIDKERLTNRMRDVMSPEAIEEFIADIDSIEADWCEDTDERKPYYTDIVSKGDVRRIVAMLKALYAHRAKLDKMNRRMYVSDERSIRDGEKLIQGEIAHVFGLHPSEVAQFVEERRAARSN